MITFNKIRISELDENGMINLSLYLSNNCDWELPPRDHLLFWLSDPQTGEVFSMLTVNPIQFNDQICFEIYNVCVSINHRRKKYATQLIKKLIENYPLYPMWLFVELENEPAYKLYVNLGFGYPVKTTTTLLGVPLGREVIALSFLGPTTKQYKNLLLDNFSNLHN